MSLDMEPIASRYADFERSNGSTIEHNACLSARDVPALMAEVEHLERALRIAARVIDIKYVDSAGVSYE